VWYCEQRRSVCDHPVVNFGFREADYCCGRAKRYERLMKANGIHPNGGPSTTPPMTPPPATKALSKAAIAKAAAVKRRKIEGNSASRMKHDEEEDEPLKPKLEPISHQMAYPAVKAEPVSTPSMPFPVANFALSNSPTAIMEHSPRRQPFDSANSIFEEFCMPEMFAQHSFEETAVKAEQPQPFLPPPQQPRHLPPPPPAVVERLKQTSNPESRKESGKGPLESIVIAD
jgi:hypothetical protein